jgi:glycosyltransferase involved in cell wall biosynthesis
VLTCAVIPHFDHVDQFEVLLPQLSAQGMPLVVVDDASPDEAFQKLQQLLDEHTNGTILVRHTQNLGKGGAVMTGLKAALEAGYTHALQIDADGQHDVADMVRFSAVAQKHPNCIICGQPEFDKSISKLRYYARYITLSLSWLESLSTKIRDALCGFRVYPLEPVVTMFETSNPGKRMAFDPEILVRAIWADIELKFIPIKVTYPEGGKSHFHYVRDNIEISWMHTRLIVGMILRLPAMLRRNMTRQEGPATR